MTAPPIAVERNTRSKVRQQQEADVVALGRKPGLLCVPERFRAMDLPMAAADALFLWAAADAAWAEVLALSPEADTAGMRAQFICHWQYAEIRQPGKPSWNLEPWRPVVDDSEMLASGCNPGSPEESF